MRLLSPQIHAKDCSVTIELLTKNIAWRKQQKKNEKKMSFLAISSHSIPDGNNVCVSGESLSLSFDDAICNIAHVRIIIAGTNFSQEHLNVKWLVYCP